MPERKRNHPIHTANRRWELLRLRVFERDGWRCVNCGRAGRLECDHRVPIWRGGDQFDMVNLQTLCRGCHIDKTAGENRKPDPERDRWRELVKAMSTLNPL